MKISATIITLNEESNIAECLRTLDFVDEIVVLDSGSTDGTAEICRSFPKVTFHHQSWLGFGKQKNKAADLATNDWIFNIDADERISPELKCSILGLDPGCLRGFRVARENYFGHRWIRHCGWYPDYNLRLYRRTECRFRERAVHEAVECSGPVGTLSGNLLHYTYRDIADYLQRMDKYSTLGAEEIVKSGRSVSVADLLLRPGFTFFRMYILKNGWREGRTGFILSGLYAVYTFCKYAKAMEAEGRSR